MHFSHIVRRDDGAWAYVGYETDCGIVAQELNDRGNGHTYTVEAK